MFAKRTDKTLPPGLRDPTLRTISNPVMSDSVVFTQYASEIPGKPWTECVISLQPGGGPPLHYHNCFQETFTARSGGLGVTVDGTEWLLKDGESAVVKIGHIHRFYNPTDHLMEFHCRVDGIGKTEGERIDKAQRFEQVLHVVYGLAHEGAVMADGLPKNPLHLAVVCQLGDTKMVGLVGWVTAPFLNALGIIAALVGTEEALLDRFWVKWSGGDNTMKI